MDGTVRPPDSANDFKACENSEWRACRVCGTPEYRAIVYFDAGTVAPTEDAYSSVTETWTGGEVVTGTSGCTGIIHKSHLRSGSYAGGDAAGCLELRSPTGYERENYTIFADNDILTGATSFRAVADTIGSVVINGTLYPRKDMVEYQGQWYCAPHFAWKFGHEWESEYIHKAGEENKRRYD
jgi:hypothetical protein